MKTKRRLRKWIKITLAIGLIALASVIIINDLETKKQVEKCTKNGYSVGYCMAQMDIY